jgi:hypothetical protein
MNVEIGAEAALFPEKEYISRIFVAVHINISYSAREHTISSCRANGQSSRRADIPSFVFLYKKIAFICTKNP